MRRTSFEKWVRFRRRLSRRPALSSALLAVLVLAAVEGHSWAGFAAVAWLAGLLLSRLWGQAIAALLIAASIGFLHLLTLRDQGEQMKVVATEPWVEDVQASIYDVRGNSLSGCVEHDGKRIEVEFSGLDATLFEAADRLRVSGVFRPIPPLRNPQPFDFQEWMWRRGVVGQFVVRRYEVLDELAPSGLAKRYGNRSAVVLENQLTRGLDERDPGRPVLLGIILGKQGELGEEQVEAFRRSGALHVFAVSGMHVGIVALIGWMILRWLGIDRHRLAWLLIILMFAYAWVTGLRPSALRAAVMGAAVLSGLVLRRRSGGLNRLSIAVIVLLMWDGHQLFTAGFQLSFTVMASILVIGPRIERWLPLRRPVDVWLPRPLWSTGDLHWHGLVTGARGMVVVTISAWLGSLVLSAIHFHLISPAGLLASIPMVMGAFVVLGLGATSLLFAGIFPSIVALNAKLAAAMAAFAVGIGSQPWAAIDVREELPANECWVLDVDEGSAVVFGGHHFTLLDAGDERAGLFSVLPALACYGNPEGRVILSHGDVDHVGGAISLLEQSQKWEFVLPKQKSRSPALRRLNETLASADVEPEKTRKGMTFGVGGGVLRCLAEGSLDQTLGRADDLCAVWIWECDGRKVLFMNDSGIAREQSLLEEFPELAVDVLVLGKHTQDLSGTGTFIRKVKPRLVIATHQSFPGEEARSARWLDELSELGIRLMRLDQTGAVHLKLDADGISAESMRGNSEFSFRVGQ